MDLASANQTFEPLNIAINGHKTAWRLVVEDFAGKDPNSSFHGGDLISEKKNQIFIIYLFLGKWKMEGGWNSKGNSEIVTPKAKYVKKIHVHVSLQRPSNLESHF